MNFNVTVGTKTIANYFLPSVNELLSVLKQRRPIIIADERLADLYRDQLREFPTVILPTGENNKTLQTLEMVVQQLLLLGADRNSLLVGVGGGVTTDITGLVAATYMRGVDVAFIPTTLLAMVDAAIGGKNGVNVNFYKNVIGTVSQPDAIYICAEFLSTLPKAEWQNGFAEIIKYGCVLDAGLFEQLEQHYLETFMHDHTSIEHIIEHCMKLKYQLVKVDERDHGARLLLNFGHTLGHAIENTCHIPHGRAVAIGMAFAAKLSEVNCGFAPNERIRILSLLEQYGLPSSHPFDADRVTKMIASDKKKQGDQIAYILLDTIGRGRVEAIPLATIKDHLQTCN